MARKYGDHAYDQWTVDELLALAGSWPAAEFDDDDHHKTAAGVTERGAHAIYD